MVMAIGNLHLRDKLYGFSRLGGFPLLRRWQASRREFQRNESLLSDSYDNHAQRRGIPRHIWVRHSALLMEETQDHR